MADLSLDPRPSSQYSMILKYDIMQRLYGQEKKYGVELKGKTWRFDGGIQIYGENLKEFHQKMTGGRIIQNMCRMILQTSTEKK